jgi:GTP pyrophosphokinase
LDRTLTNPDSVAATLRELATRLSALVPALASLTHANNATVLTHSDSSTDSPLAAALSMARWMAELDLDEDAIVGCLLYRLVERKALEAEEFSQPEWLKAKRFALNLFKLGQLEIKSGHDRWSGSQAETLRRMLLAVVSDPRLVVARVAEQWVALNAAKTQDSATQVALAQATRDVYAPLAARLGLHALKWELEDLSFRYLEPAEYHRIAQTLNERRVDREQYLQDFLSQLQQMFTERGIHAEITGRAKHIYSIWRKMIKKNYTLTQIFDIRAVRILVDDVESCYRALSLVHERFEPIGGEFDDYIQNPKANGYQSIHSAVIGPKHHTIEIQIRSKDMHARAELGVAAHWRYKENLNPSSALDDKVALLRQLISPTQPLTAQPDPDALERAKATLFKDRIYVLSPKGDVVELPKGATGLDFAYQVHTQLGHRTKGIRIDGKMSNLTTRLDNGQTVEIITQKTPQPSRDWLNESAGFINTKSARAKLRSWFREHDYAQHLKDGRALLELTFNRKQHAITGLELAQALKYASVDALCVALGSNDLSKEKLQAALHRVVNQTMATAETQLPITALAASEGQVVKPSAKGLTVMGVDDVLCHLARCCKPVKPEAILGYSTVGRGISLHRDNCRNLKSLLSKHPERVFKVHWGNEPSEVYAAEFVVVAVDRTGLVRDVSQVLADAKCSIERMSSQTHATRQTAELKLTVSVHDASSLAIVLEKIRHLDGVLSVRRLSH